jgi:class 3 adenylate cyclase/tetratricopeptide (TPR) repeat protein
MAATENITVLFTDLVGSTELSSSLSPSAADELRRVHFATLRDAVADAGGTEVKNLGDGLMVVFQATAPALSCAVAMQQAIVRRNKKIDVPLAVRIGVSAGDVTVEDGDYFGEPVVEAARLCAAALGGQILVTDVVKTLARRSGHRFAAERAMDLKGLPEPVVAWEVVWEVSDSGEGIPLPSRLPQVPNRGVVGRTAEVARLDHALQEVGNGDPRVVLLSGEAGIGKSTLLSHCARQAHAHGAVVLYGRCDEDLAVPYRPFAEALRHYVSHADDAELAELVDEHRVALARLVPEVRKRFTELTSAIWSDADAERWMLYGAVVALIERAASHAPVMLIADDLHWSDTPSLQLFRHLSTSLAGRVLIVGTYRDIELSAAHPLTDALAALAREPSVTRIELSGLGSDEVISFVEAAAGHSLDDSGTGLARALYRETDGNPLFVGEVLRHLVETGAVALNDEGRWELTGELSEAGLPESLRQVIGARVRRLGAELAEALSAAAVLGQEFDSTLLSKMVGIEEEPLLELLESAVSSALLVETPTSPGHFRFAHALIQHTIDQELGPNRRARLHRAAAEALEETYGDDPGVRAGELARHWLVAARPHELAKAVRCARLAGEHALDALAPAEALRWFDEALEVLARAPDDHQRARCLAGLGEAQRQVGDELYRETLLDASRLARSIGDRETLVLATLANSRGWASVAGEVDEERIAELQAAVDSVPTNDVKPRARLLALLAHERSYDGDLPGRQTLADEALELARRSGDPATLLDVLLHRRQAIWVPDTVEQLLAESTEAVTLADELGDPASGFTARVTRSIFSVQVGDVASVARDHEACTRLAAEVGQPILKWTDAAQRGWSVLLAGDAELADALVTESLQVGLETGQPDAFPIYGGQLFCIRWHQGRLGEIVDVMVQTASEHSGLSIYRSLAALALTETGRDREARAMLETESAAGFPAHDDFLRPGYLDLWARVASHLGDREAAAVLYDYLAPWPTLVVCTAVTVQGAVAHNLGTLARVLGRHEEAEAHFTQALEVHRRLAAPFYQALTQLEWARTLRDRGSGTDLVNAEAMLQSSLATAAERGFAAVDRAARRELEIVAATASSRFTT